jgi:hypothetical protein
MVRFTFAEPVQLRQLPGGVLSVPRVWVQHRLTPAGGAASASSASATAAAAAATAATAAAGRQEQHGQVQARALHGESHAHRGTCQLRGCGSGSVWTSTGIRWRCLDPEYEFRSRIGSRCLNCTLILEESFMKKYLEKHFS